MYLIHGVFFQNYASLGISFASGEGTAVIKTEFAFFVFHGVIGRPMDNPVGPLFGEIHDQFGEARLADINVLVDGFSFRKKYKRRSDEIFYTFRKLSNGTWEGGYRGVEDVGEGFARCTLVEVPDDFFIPPPEAIEKAKRAYEEECVREAARVGRPLKKDKKKRKTRG